MTRHLVVLVGCLAACAENLKILADSGFEASALDVRRNRALIACVKTSAGA